MQLVVYTFLPNEIYRNGFLVSCITFIMRIGKIKFDNSIRYKYEDKSGEAENGKLVNKDENKNNSLENQKINQVKDLNLINNVC